MFAAIRRALIMRRKFILDHDTAVSAAAASVDAAKERGNQPPAVAGGC